MAIRNMSGLQVSLPVRKVAIVSPEVMKTGTNAPMVDLGFQNWMPPAGVAPASTGGGGMIQLSTPPVTPTKTVSMGPISSTPPMAPAITAPGPSAALPPIPKEVGGIPTVAIVAAAGVALAAGAFFIFRKKGRRS